MEFRLKNRGFSAKNRPVHWLPLLKQVSRSFYLSIRLLPARVRRPIGLAFLACKTADTIADTTLIPAPKRLQLLEHFRELIRHPRSATAREIVTALDAEENGSDGERRLLQAFPELIDALQTLPTPDREQIQWLVLELTEGMRLDLSFFGGANGKLKALQSFQGLDQYTYYVAGIVGRFWTRMMRNHFRFAHDFDEAVEKTGENLGKGLQWVNILRDLPRDLRQGRCYIPKDLLTKYALEPEHLLDPDNIDEARSCLMELVAEARSRLLQSEHYCRFFPWYALRLKTVVRLPALLGLETLSLLENSNEWLNPDVVIKVPRKTVYVSLFKLCFFSM